MGGNTSRMVKEIIEDSRVILRATGRNAYEQQVVSRKEAQHQMDMLRHLQESEELTKQSSRMIEQLKDINTTKKHLNDAGEEFAKQFELQTKEFESLVREQARVSSFERVQATLERAKHPDQEKFEEQDQAKDTTKSA